MTKKQTTEEGIQRVVIEMRDLWAPQIPRLGLLFHIPNGGQRKSGEAGRLKAMGTVPGMPDLCLPVRTQRFGALYIELKKPGGKLSKAQEERIPRLREAGNDVQVCDSIEKAWANILWHLADKPVTESLRNHEIFNAAKSLTYPLLATFLDESGIAGAVEAHAESTWRFGRDGRDFAAFVFYCSRRS